MRYAYKYNYEWTADMAYLIGLFASDGCLAKNGRHLIMTSKDIEIINNVKRIAKTQALPRLKMGGFGTMAYDLQFSNVALYDFMVAAGLTPAKSKTLKVTGIPTALYPDYLRGFFDGDGSVHGYKDLRWPNSYMYYVSFTCANKDYLEWLRAQNTELIGSGLGKLRLGKRAYVLSYAKHDSQRLFLAMYHCQQLPLLTRKYEKFVAFLESDPYASKELRARVLELVDRLA